MEEVQIPSPLVWKEAKTKRTLIGKVLMNKSYTRSTMEAILRKAWNLQSDFELHNIPLEALCEENAITIGGYVGEVMLVEDPHYNESNEPRYEAWLTTNVARSWDETLVIVRCEEVEAFDVKKRKEEAFEKRRNKGRQKVHSKPKMDEEDIFAIRIVATSSGKKV
ncbi:hypothetical protein K1719_006443 [Acacia pycnantha]|nr:hypothetical protein K1719_006443 [Acacia pycnantha]